MVIFEEVLVVEVVEVLLMVLIEEVVEEVS